MHTQNAYKEKMAQKVKHVCTTTVTSQHQVLSVQGPKEDLATQGLWVYEYAT